MKYEELIVEDPRGYSRYIVGENAKFYLFGTDFSSLPDMYGDFEVKKIIRNPESVTVVFVDDYGRMISRLHIPFAKVYYLKEEKS